MVSDVIIYGLAVIGALVVAYAVLKVLYWFVIPIILVGFERGLDAFGKIAFYMGDGGENDRPRPPYDRIWIEIMWAKKWVRWTIRELGYTPYENVGTPDRPDIYRLYELRRETYATDTDPDDGD